jgi:hypothetical protein
MADDYGWLHEVLGLHPDEYEMRLSDGESMPATLDPRWHSHPILGITGHSHSKVEDARRPHGHHPEVGWNFDPVFVGAPSDWKAVAGRLAVDLWDATPTELQRRDR